MCNKTESFLKILRVKEGRCKKFLLTLIVKSRDGILLIVTSRELKRATAITIISSFSITAVGHCFSGKRAKFIVFKGC